MKTWRTVLLLAILAWMSVGGTFTCRAHSGDDTVIIHSKPTSSPSK